jgi:hypothetical protein
MVNRPARWLNHEYIRTAYIVLDANTRLFIFECAHEGISQRDA